MFRAPADLTHHRDADQVDGWLYGIGEFSGPEAIAVKAAGFMHGNYQLLGPKATGTPKDWTWEVMTSIDLFKSAKGAHAGYRAEQYSSGQPVKAKTIGDESHALRDDPGQDPENSNRPDHGYTFLFRVDRIVATLFVDRYDGTSPDATDAEALAHAFAERIKDVQTGKRKAPDLSLAALHFDLSDNLGIMDNYLRLDGKNLVSPSRYATLPAGDPTFDQIYPHATEVYWAGQNLVNRGVAPTYRARFATFTSRYWAAKWVKTYLAGARPATPSTRR